MRLPLANTLRNRDSTTDKDARLLNCVVDTKKRVIKRPSLVANYEVTTPGQGLGLFVRNVPKTPDGDDDSELIAIAGSILTTSPPLFGATVYSVGVVQFGPFPTLYGFALAGVVNGAEGTISPANLRGSAIRALYNDTSGGTVSLNVEGIHASSFFTSMTWGSITLTSASATFSTSGGNSNWQWTSSWWGAVTSTEEVTITYPA